MRKETRMAGSSSNNRGLNIWKVIWNIKVPPKVLHVLWRLCKDILPTRVKLRRRGIGVETDCLCCGFYKEDAAHVLFQCPTAVSVWKASPFPGIKKWALHESASDWLLQISTMYNE